MHRQGQSPRSYEFGRKVSIATPRDAFEWRTVRARRGVCSQKAGKNLAREAVGGKKSGRNARRWAHVVEVAQHWACVGVAEQQTLRSGGVSYENDHRLSYAAGDIQRVAWLH